MCGYCNADILNALAINKKDEAVIINQDVETKEYFIDGLEERIYIEYCPMCRKEAGRVKTILGKYVETLDNHKGIVVKQYKPTGRNMDSIHIQQENGRIWYCPISDLIYIEEESYDK